jgi:polyisoprenyl-phosphate glycosyltransferase
MALARSAVTAASDFYPIHPLFNPPSTANRLRGNRQKTTVLVLVHEHPVLDVPPDGACEDDPLDVAPDLLEFLDGEPMRDARDVLLDDRPRVELLGDVVRGGADDLHALVAGAAVRVGAHERAALQVGRVLVGAEDVGVALGEESGDRGDDPVPVGNPPRPTLVPAPDAGQLPGLSRAIFWPEAGTTSRLADTAERVNRLVPTYSLVVPAYNEEGVIEELAARLSEVMDALDGDAEAILVDDGSRDRTYERMLEAAREEPRLRLVRLSRNFGHQIALTAGVDVADGDAVIVLDADLQDPPEVVLELAARWREGYDVVYAVREAREGETRFKRTTASAFYRAFNRISEVQVPLDVGDFRLVDRRALDVFSQMRESNRFVRGMFSWIGLRQTGVAYTRQERFAGETKYPLRKMLRFAATGVISFSGAPLRAALNLGFFVSFVAFALGIWSVIVKVSGLYEVPGWTSIVVVTTFIGGIQLIVLGVIGEYIGDIHAEVKRRPLYVVSELENFPDVRPLPPRAIVADRRLLPSGERGSPLGAERAGARET